MPPHAVLGTMTFGAQTSEADAKEQIRLLVARSPPNQVILDTARLYRGGNVEKVLGGILASEPAWKPQIHTKADPSITRLDFAGLSAQLEASLAALRIERANVFYLHMPDSRVPLEETLEACARLHAQGKFDELGLSNYPAWEVVRAHALCRERGWCVPTVYQGVYHVLSRSIEYELIPALRTLGMRLNVFSPLCGGLLAQDRYTDASQQHSTGRFSPEYHNHHLYVERYFHKQNFEALRLIREHAQGIPTHAVALRWLCFHSYMRDGDGIVFGGGAGTERCAADLACLADGPLPPALVSLIQNQVAELVYPVQAQYFRGFDARHGRADRYLKSL